MVANLAFSEQDFERQPISSFTEKAYLDYSMYVIQDRALPHISDGLKPVQRRIIYAMSELGLSNIAKYKKSARTVGDVLGKFHPHGDSACYEAMVLLAQPFSYRYPLIDGQGNWGSIDDPKSFAAMRYTEAKLAKFAEIYLRELAQGTVDWLPNFDGTMTEPKNLPARVPTILLNGTTGIAVGMATDILPHNLTEVVTACIHLLKNPQSSISDVLKFIKGPDFPNQAEIITPKADIKRLYATGNGSIKARAVFKKEKSEIIITALPHQVSSAKILEQIAAQMQAKKLPQLVDLRDESDHENPVRLVLVLKTSKIDEQDVMAHLFATTDLERSYRVNMNVIGLDGKPKVKNLLEILTEWLEFRLDTVTKRLNFRLDKVKARLHILDGLLIAFLNLDKVIKIIRENDKPKPILIKQFKISEIQADAILDLKLRQLAKLEEQKIRAEQKDLTKEQNYLEGILGSKTKLKNLVSKELEEVIDDFGDKRRSKIVERFEAKQLTIVERVPESPITVILSQKGWVRQAKGHEVDGKTLNYKALDGFLTQLRTKSSDLIYFFDSSGRSYTMLAANLPSARGIGDPLSSKFNPVSGVSFVGLLAGDTKAPVVLAASNGYGFCATLEDLATKNKNGKQVIKVSDNFTALEPQIVTDLKMRLVLITSDLRMLIMDVTELPQMAKGKGNKLIALPEGESLKFTCLMMAKQSLSIQTDKKLVILKPKDLDDYLGDRGKRGFKLPRNVKQVLGVSVE